MRDEDGYEKNIVDKILGYYFALADLASIEDIGDENGSTYSKYIKLMDLIEFEPDEKKIKLRLNKTKIEINCKKCKKYNLYDDNYYDKVIEFENIPELPQEIYQNFTNINIELKKSYYKTIV